MLTIPHRHRLEPQIIETLQGLVHINAACCIGYRTIAQAIKHEQLTRFFMLLAWERSLFAEELSRVLSAHGVNILDLDDDWMGVQIACWSHDLRDRSNTSDHYTVLAEVYRREEVTFTFYDEVVHEATGSGIHEMLRRHHHQIKADRDKIAALKSTLDDHITNKDTREAPSR